MLNIVLMTILGSLVSTLGLLLFPPEDLQMIQIAARYLAGGLVGTALAIVIADLRALRPH